MYALHTRIAELNGFMLLKEMAQLWRHFYSEIVSYIEAVFHELHSLSLHDLLLSSFRDHVFIPAATAIEGK
jgi:hypothetical protein